MIVLIMIVMMLMMIVMLSDDDGDGFQLQLCELQLGWRPLETCGSEPGVASTMAAITLQHRSHNQLHQNTPAP